MAEIAAHALSPGINEPFTALTCIDWLGASLRSVACLEMPSSYRHDEDGRLRLIAEPISFDELVQASFDQIRIYGSDNYTVMKRLVTTIGELAPHLKRRSDCDSLLSYLEIAIEDTNRDIPNKKDGLAIKQAYSQAWKALEAQHMRLSDREQISSS